MGVTRAQAEEEVKTFNTFFATLSPAKRKSYYGDTKASLKHYKCCHNMDLRRAKKGEGPLGITLSPVIWEKS